MPDAFLDTLFKDIPEALQPSLKMEQPNQEICIYDGVFTILANEQNFECVGKVVLQWLPTIKLKATGHVDLTNSLTKAFKRNEHIQIFTHDTLLGRALFTQLNSDSSYRATFSAQLEVNDIIGNTEGPLSHILFEIPNLKPFIANSIKTGYSSWKGRFVLECANATIHLDQLKDITKSYAALQEVGGYCLTYTGLINPKNRTLMTSEVFIIIKALHYFLSFIDGRRVSPVFLQGIGDNGGGWKQLQSHHVDAYKEVFSWCSKFHVDSLGNLWNEFLAVFNANEHDWLTTCVHWYLEANKRSGYAEGSIVMIQCALELLYNWAIVENGLNLNVVSPKRSTASEKIKLLLTSLQLESEIPSSLVNTFAYYNGKGHGPEILTEIRNAVVHSAGSKRKKLDSIPSLVYVEVLNLGIYYVEMTLLKCLKYKGPVIDRTKRIKYLN